MELAYRSYAIRIDSDDRFQNRVDTNVLEANEDSDFPIDSSLNFSVGREDGIGAIWKDYGTRSIASKKGPLLSRSTISTECSLSGYRWNPRLSHLRVANSRRGGRQSLAECVGLETSAGLVARYPTFQLEFRIKVSFNVRGNRDDEDDDEENENIIAAVRDGDYDDNVSSEPSRRLYRSAFGIS
uniref:Uncharacterized protein n=1 Tax=Vespula pensylvanica TaxID=30213 RepID=A0A834NQ98_VESPE|nr:hypothetical protein H0235_012102 [Vespula pensylvanica]